MDENLLKLVNEIEKAKSNAIKKSLISKLPFQGDKEEVFKILTSLYFKEKLPPIKAHIISTIASLQDIEHLDFFETCFKEKNTIINKSLSRCIWLYDINEKLEYCRKNIEDENKIPFILEILKGIDQKESLQLLDKIANRYPQYKEISLKYRNFLWDKIKKYYPLKVRNPFLFYTLITLPVLLGITAFLYFHQKKDNKEKTPTIIVIDKKIKHSPQNSISSPEKKENKFFPNKIIKTSKEKKKKRKITPILIITSIKRLVQKRKFKKTFLILKKYYSILIKKKKLILVLNFLPQEFWKKYGINLYTFFQQKKVNLPFSALVKFYSLKNIPLDEKEKLRDQILTHPNFKLPLLKQIKITFKPLPLYLLKTEKEKLTNFFYYLTRGDYLKALKIYQKFSPKNKKKLFHLKENIVKQIKLEYFIEQPIQYFAFKLNKKDFSTKKDYLQWKQIVILSQTDKLKKIEKIIKQTNFNPPHLKFLILGCFYYQKMGNFPKALKYFIKYLKKEPQNEGVKVLMGRAYLNLNFMEEAQQLFEELLHNTKDPIIKKLATQHLTFIKTLNETF